MKLWDTCESCAVSQGDGAVVQAVDLENATGEAFAIFENSVLERFHGKKR